MRSFFSSEEKGKGTLGGVAEGGVVGWEQSKSFFGDFYDSVEDGWAELFVLFSKGEVDDFVDFSECLAEEGVEVIFDAIVGAAEGEMYRPESLLPITAHLLPS